MSNLFSTAGSKIYIGGQLAWNGGNDLDAASFASQVWTEITGHTNLGAAGDTSALITSDHIGAGRTRKMKGVRNAGSMSLACDLDYADVGQLALIAAEKTKQTYAIRVVFSDKPAERSAVATITIAAPGVVTWTAHGLVVGQKVKFTTTGALPTGLTAGTEYYVKTTPSADTFTVSSTAGGTAITTTGSQSGVHTAVTVPTGSERLFTALVMSAAEEWNEANSVMKLNATLEIDSNIVRVAALG